MSNRSKEFYEDQFDLNKATVVKCAADLKRLAGQLETLLADSTYESGFRVPYWLSDIEDRVRTIHGLGLYMAGLQDATKKRSRL